MPKQTAHTKNAKAAPTRKAEGTAEAISERNEQSLERAMKPAQEHLDPYETNMTALADYQDKVADAAQAGSEPGASMARAQANLARQIRRAHTTNVGAGNQSDPVTSVAAGGGTSSAPELADGVVDIAYERFGNPDAPPVLLVMGLGAQMLGCPAEFCRQLADRGLHVVRFDNRDVGESTHLANAPEPDLMAVIAGDTSSASYTLSDLAADTIGLLDALDLDSAHIVGASLGGMIAQTVAIEHPERVRSLTSIMSSTSDPTVGQPLPKAVKAMVAAPPRTREEAMDCAVALARVIGSPGYPLDEDEVRERAGSAYDRGSDPDGAARQLTAALASPDRTSALRSVGVPALVLHGAQDPLVDVSGAHATANALPNAELVIIDGMGHDLPRQLWEDVAGRIADLIDGFERPVGA